MYSAEGIRLVNFPFPGPHLGVEPRRKRGLDGRESGFAPMTNWRTPPILRPNPRIRKPHARFHRSGLGAVPARRHRGVARWPVGGGLRGPGAPGSAGAGDALSADPALGAAGARDISR